MFIGLTDVFDSADCWHCTVRSSVFCFVQRLTNAGSQAEPATSAETEWKQQVLTATYKATRDR